MHQIENEKGSLADLLTKVQTNQSLKEDYTAPTTDLQLITKNTIEDKGTNTPEIVLEAKGGMPTKVFRANDVALQQMASKAEIDIRTVRRLRDHYPNELDTVINAIWQKEPKGSLADLLTKVQTNQSLKEDYTAPTTDLQLITKNTIEDKGTNTPEIVLEAKGGMPTKVFRANDVALQQMASKAEIDIRTVRRLRDHYPNELDTVINAIWQKEPKGVMLRTFTDMENSDTGVLRALTSSSYKVFDNEDVLQTTLPQLMDSEANWQEGS